MKTFWLYYGTLLVAAVRLPASASDHDVKVKAIDQQERHPTMSHLYPDHTPGSILNLIHKSEVKTFDEPLAMPALCPDDHGTLRPI